MAEFPVFVKRGDCRAEVDRVIREMELTPEEAGFQKYIYVTQGSQTVVMVAGRDVPVADALRRQQGWLEPVEGS